VHHGREGVRPLTALLKGCQALFHAELKQGISIVGHPISFKVLDLDTTTFEPLQKGEMERSYQITIRGGRYGILIFRGDRYYDQGTQTDVKTLEEAIARLRSWIQAYRWGAGPCRLRNIDTDEWRELGRIEP
jgi:hypothetical protein